MLQNHFHEKGLAFLTSSSLPFNNQKFLVSSNLMLSLAPSILPIPSPTLFTTIVAIEFVRRMYRLPLQLHQTTHHLNPPSANALEPNSLSYLDLPKPIFWLFSLPAKLPYSFAPSLLILTSHICYRLASMKTTLLLSLSTAPCGYLILLAVAGINNIANALTKVLAWILHYCHIHCSMGDHSCQFTVPPAS
jgi:hypothetical protein